MLTLPTMQALQDRMTTLTMPTTLTNESKPRADALSRDEKHAKPCP